MHYNIYDTGARSHLVSSSKQKLVTLNSHMNSANKAICYAEVINMYSLRELFNSTPVHPYTTHHNGTYNTHWY